MKIIFLQQAFEELNHAISYYEEQQAGLGLRLKEEVDRHVRWLSDHSSVPRIRKGGYRRINLKVFPYYIAYIVHQDILWLLAVAHNHRKPVYWIKRKRQAG